MDDKQAKFFPYHAINEYMLPEYRLKVIQTVYLGLDRLSKERRSDINGLVKRYVQVPGFRNSSQAPAGVKGRASVSAFEQHPDFVAQVLQSWSELHPDLRQKVYEFLKEREWEVLPPEADRTRLPGFLPDWPKEQNYDVLEDGFKGMFPDFPYEQNDLRLMIVWLSERLPFGLDEEEETTGA